MKLASLRSGRDGCLVVVSRDLARCVPAATIAPTLQAALDGWDLLEPRLRSLAVRLESGDEPGVPFDEAACAAPLPRAYQWADGSAYLNHVELVRRARGAAVPATFYADPLLYQGGSDAMLGPRDPIPLPDEAWGGDFEGELAVITDDVPCGVATEQALGHVRLVMLCNDVSLRNLVPAELAKGFGFFQSKPPSAFSPVAVTPDELGEAWHGGRVNLPLAVDLNGEPFGRVEAGEDATFGFAELVAHAARTRPLGAGTIIGSGTVSNRGADGRPGLPLRDGGRGYSCLAEMRMVETILHGAPATPFLRRGDRVTIAMHDAAGHSIFGRIDQMVGEAAGAEPAQAPRPSPPPPDFGILQRLVAASLGPERAEYVLSALAIDPSLGGNGALASRAQVAMALNAVLFSDLLQRVPLAASHVAELWMAERKACFDHGALRTIDGDTGALPRGHHAFARILEPLGYGLAGLYPLPALRMTGRAYAHRDLPETVPQFFVSELHLSELPDEARAAAARIFGGSTDPLGDAERALLATLGRTGECPVGLALSGLDGLVNAFGRHHPVPALADYEALLRHSPEAAWIATEGNAFNHATDRVPDVITLAAALKAKGLPLKETVEVSAGGRIHQTAFLAGTVPRLFRVADGTLVERDVPGSFFEFIARAIHPATHRIDLAFDSGNATGIFAVTRAG